MIDAVKAKYTGAAINASQINVNGYYLYADKIKYPGIADIKIKYVEKSNIYNVLPE